MTIHEISGYYLGVIIFALQPILVTALAAFLAFLLGKYVVSYVRNKESDLITFLFVLAIGGFVIVTVLEASSVLFDFVIQSLELELQNLQATQN